MAMTGDALNIVLGKSEQSCFSLLAYYGHKSSQCLEVIMRNEGGTKKAFEEVLKKKEPLGNPEDVAATIQLLDRVTGDYCQSGTLFRLYLQPIHALAELSYWATLTEDLDAWKRALVKMVDARRQGGCDIRLYDFSGFNSITTEEIHQTTGNDSMQNYWEQSHYRSEVGLKILEEPYLIGWDRHCRFVLWNVQVCCIVVERAKRAIDAIVRELVVLGFWASGCARGIVGGDRR